MSNPLRSRIAEVLEPELDEHGYEDDDEKRRRVADHFAAVVTEALGLTEEIREREVTTAYMKTGVTQMWSRWATPWKWKSET